MPDRVHHHPDLIFSLGTKVVTLIDIPGAGGLMEGATTVTTVTAVDPDSGVNLTFAISGGADASNFTIDAGTGALRFIGAPDFELPTDVGADNIYEVQVRVSDGSLTDTQTIAVSVGNVAPTAGITGPASANAGQNLSFTLSATDPVAAPSAAYRFDIDWDEDDVIDQTVTGPSGLVVMHGFADRGSHEIMATATDAGGAVSEPATHIVQIASGSGGAGTVAQVGNDLVITGRDGNDVITIRRGRPANSIVVRINGVRFGPFTPTGQIVARGLAGNDRILVGAHVTLASLLDGGTGNDCLRGGKGNDILLGGDGDDELVASRGNDMLEGGAGNDLLRAGDGNDILRGGDGNDEFRAAQGIDLLEGGAGDDLLRGGDGNDMLFGNAGNDVLRGGDGDDILVGGYGDDLLQGGQGRDFMIGGSGANRLGGNADDDILIAGYTADDANAAALMSIMHERAECASYGARVINITTGTGLAGGVRLVGDDGAAQTVFNDNDVDTLTGNQDRDWFFANRIADSGGALDVVTDKAANELWTDTDFLAAAKTPISHRLQARVLGRMFSAERVSLGSARSKSSTTRDSE